MHHRRSPIVRRDDDGASLVEYGLMIALIAVVAFSAVSFFGGGGEGLMNRNQECIRGAMAEELPEHCH